MLFALGVELAEGHGVAELALHRDIVYKILVESDRVESNGLNLVTWTAIFIFIKSYSVRFVDKKLGQNLIANG
jgi:hypothetical protein